MPPSTQGRVGFALIGALALACAGPRPAAPELPPTISVSAPPTGATASPPRPLRIGPAWLGVKLEHDAEGRGVLVESVIPGSPAAHAGLQPNDLILKLDGEPVAEPARLTALVQQRYSGDRVSLAILRAGRHRLFAAQLGALPERDEVLRMAFVDQPAPAFEAVEPAQGDPPITLAGLRGRVVVLEFWAPWCPMCRVLGPELSEWHGELTSRGGLVLGITTEEREEAAGSAREIGIEYPLLVDARGQTTRAYQAFALPALFVIDRRGVVRDLLIGYSSERLAELHTLVEALLAEPAPPT